MANVLRISDAASLALHTTVLLAARQPQLLSTPTIAEALHASKAHLAKVLQRLRRAQLVESVRGPTGGFRLSRPADTITLAEVYEAIEGPVSFSKCLLATPICGGENCILGDMVPTLNARVREYLSETTVADVAGVFQHDTEPGK